MATWPVMIPDHLAELLGTEYARAGTRDAANTPSAHLVTAVVVHPDRRHITILIPEFSAGGLRENLADNGTISATMSNHHSEAYQLKGRAIDVRAPSEVELEAERAVFGRLTELARNNPNYPPHWADLFDSIELGSGVAVTLEVHEIYNQTPGPHAGQKIAGLEA